MSEIRPCSYCQAGKDEVGNPCIICDGTGLVDVDHESWCEEEEDCGAPEITGEKGEDRT